MHTASLPPSLMLSSVPFSHSLSPFSKLASAREVVVERRWSWSSVTERDELVGRISEVSRLPQYLQSLVRGAIVDSRTPAQETPTRTHLIQAMLTGAVAVAS
jgi:hypothetical protein